MERSITEIRLDLLTESMTVDKFEYILANWAMKITVVNIAM